MAFRSCRNPLTRIADVHGHPPSSNIFGRHQNFHTSTKRCRYVNTSRHHATATVTATTSLISTPSSSSLKPPRNHPLPESTPQSTRLLQETLQPLPLLPYPALIRGWAISAVTSSRALLPLSIWLLRKIAYTKSLLLSADSNPIIRWLLKRTVYAQFCAGENAGEVKATIAQLRRQGVDGVLLGCGKELEIRRENSVEEGEAEVRHRVVEKEQKDGVEWEVKEWERCTLETIAMAPGGNFVSIKLTGAGPLVRHALSHSLSPPIAVEQAISRFTDLARSRRVSLGIDAEQTHFQSGIDTWVIKWASRYNRRTSSFSPSTPLVYPPSSSSAQDSSVQSTSSHLDSGDESYTTIYNTYQAYLRSTAKLLASHLLRAQQEGFVLGVKLVRGAYLASEPEHLPWGSKEATDSAYDQIAESIVRRRWIGVLKDALNELDRTETKDERGERSFPQVTFLLATHNLPSVRKIMAIRQAQAESGEPRIPMVYAQLMGMADHITGELVNAAAHARAIHPPCSEEGEDGKIVAIANGMGKDVEIPKVWKYLVWGGVGECAKYLVRRAEENRDAVRRTGEARREFGREARKRIKRFVTG